MCKHYVYESYICEYKKIKYMCLLYPRGLRVGMWVYVQFIGAVTLVCAQHAHVGVCLPVHLCADCEEPGPQSPPLLCGHGAGSSGSSLLWMLRVFLESRAPRMDILALLHGRDAV